MSNLNEALPPIIEKLEKHRNIYEKNEMAVRIQIINPILKNLGWDPENPAEVQHNVSTEEGGVPDYVLIKDGKNILFVEAKNLNVNIEDKDVFRQLAKYTFDAGTKYGVLTNGAIWILIKSFEEGTPLNKRIVWKVDLKNDKPEKVLRNIMTISKTNIEHIEVLVKKAQILDEIWQSLLVDEREKMIMGLLPVVKLSISERYSDYQFEDGEIEDFLKVKVKEIILASSEEDAPIAPPQESLPRRGGTPRRMILKGEVFELRNSFEILVNVANWLIKNGKLKPSDCPVDIGRGKRHLINKKPIHNDDKDFQTPKILSNGLWIETNYSTNACIDYAKRLLTKFGFSPDILTIE